MLADDTHNPALIRSVLAANLQQLVEDSGTSVSELCRVLRINRTQFNRYRAGESFPRPDVLHLICEHFGVDARILLQPIDEVLRLRDGTLGHSEVSGFIGAGKVLPESSLPSGFYRLSTPGDLAGDRHVLRLCRIYRRDGITFFRGFDSVDVAQLAGRATDRISREFRGLIFAQGKGIAALGSRRRAAGATFSYLEPVKTDLGGPIWIGHSLRNGDDALTAGVSVTLICEHLGAFGPEVMATARAAGVSPFGALPQRHRDLLSRRAAG